MPQPDAELWGLAQPVFPVVLSTPATCTVAAPCLRPDQSMSYGVFLCLRW